MILAAALSLALLQDTPVILPMRERAALRDRWLEERLDVVVPMLMRRESVQMWVLIAREYNDDPVLRTMLPATWFGARRRTILVFHDNGPEEGVERFAVARYAVGDAFPSAWDKEAEPDQWKRLRDLIVERDPERIALNVSPTFALADGLSSSEHRAFLAAMPEEIADRVVPGVGLAIGWLETRTPAEMEVYPTICRIAHDIIAEGLSNAAVQPGHTTTADLEWWYRDRIRELKLTAWFHPSVSVQRKEGLVHLGTFATEPDTETIRRGDLVHVDFGITYLGLNTDTQQHAYVLRAGEEDAPEGLKVGMQVGNRLQDVLTSHFAAGRSGNEILRLTLEQAAAEGIEGKIYTHPIGYHGHGAGPLIGLWDQQEGVPGRGDYPLHPRTAHSIELQASVRIPEWDGQKVAIMLEEDAFFDGRETRYIDGRQSELLLIR